MPSPPRRSKKDSDRGTKDRSLVTQRPPAQQRTKGDSPRALLLGAIGFTTLAALVDWLACAFTMSEYRKCGHLHFDLMMIGMGLSLTIGSVYTFRAWWKARRAARQPTPAARPKPKV